MWRQSLRMFPSLQKKVDIAQPSTSVDGNAGEEEEKGSEPSGVSEIGEGPEAERAEGAGSIGTEGLRQRVAAAAGGST